ncbi:MAG: hypothetical protein V4735_00975 [Pseudomonadota bacterium]
MADEQSPQTPQVKDANDGIPEIHPHFYSRVTRIAIIVLLHKLYIDRHKIMI